eukprot:403349318
MESNLRQLIEDSNIDQTIQFAYDDKMSLDSLEDIQDKTSSHQESSGIQSPTMQINRQIEMSNIQNSIQKFELEDFDQFSVKDNPEFSFANNSRSRPTANLLKDTPNERASRSGTAQNQIHPQDSHPKSRNDQRKNFETSSCYTIGMKVNDGEVLGETSQGPRSRQIDLRNKTSDAAAETQRKLLSYQKILGYVEIHFLKDSGYMIKRISDEDFEDVIAYMKRRVSDSTYRYIKEKNQKVLEAELPKFRTLGSEIYKYMYGFHYQEEQELINQVNDRKFPVIVGEKAYFNGSFSIKVHTKDCFLSELRSQITKHFKINPVKSYQVFTKMYPLLLENSKDVLVIEKSEKYQKFQSPRSQSGYRFSRTSRKVTNSDTRSFLSMTKSQIPFRSRSKSLLRSQEKSRRRRSDYQSEFHSRGDFSKNCQSADLSSYKQSNFDQSKCQRSCCPHFFDTQSMKSYDRGNLNHCHSLVSDTHFLNPLTVQSKASSFYDDSRYPVPKFMPYQTGNLRSIIKSSYHQNDYQALDSNLVFDPSLDGTFHNKRRDTKFERKTVKFLDRVIDGKSDQQSLISAQQKQRSNASCRCRSCRYTPPKSKRSRRNSRRDSRNHAGYSSSHRGNSQLQDYDSQFKLRSESGKMRKESEISLSKFGLNAWPDSTSHQSQVPPSILKKRSARSFETSPIKSYVSQFKN